MTDTNSNSTQIPLKSFYTYALIDPRPQFSSRTDGDIFYIGKGQKKRVLAHAQTVKINSRSSDTCTDQTNPERDVHEENDSDAAEESIKNQRIFQIQQAGFEVMERIIGRFDTEAEAYAVEATLIHWVYGRTQEGGNLTNIQAGRHHLHIRDRGDFEQRERLDVCKNIRSDSGQYSSIALKRLTDKNIQNIAEDTIDALRSRITIDGKLPRVTVNDAQIIESGRYVGAVVDLGEPDVILRLQFTPTTLITNLRARDEGSKKGRNAFAAQMQSVGLSTKGNDHYGWIDDWKGQGLPFHDHAGILLRIEKACRQFASPKIPIAHENAG